MTVFYVWLLGGYFNNSCYGRFKEENLPGEDILMHHYDNPVAKMQGVTILGITQKGPDDITIVEQYKWSHTQGPNVYYVCQGEVDPDKVQMIGDELYFKPDTEQLESGEPIRTHLSLARNKLLPKRRRGR